MAKQTKKGIKKPNIFAWIFYTFCSRVFLFFKHHIKYDRKAFKKRNKKEGCIVIYNHDSNFDHYITTASFKYTRTHYVITKHFYFSKKLRKILDIVAAVPREQFKSDITSIKTIKKIIDSGGIITIAPAGQIAVHGEMPYIDKAIVKLLKFCKVDIYALQMHGNYLAYPKWHKVKRSFPLHTNFLKVMSKEDLQTLNDDDIYSTVVECLNFCDLDEQKVNPKVIKSKDLIKGLDNILYYCPKCKSKYTLNAENNRLVCSKCHNTVRMDEYGFLRPVGDDCIMFENEAEWYKYQKELLKKEIKENRLHIESEFLLKRNINDEWTLEDVGTGKLVLTNNSFYYDGTILDKHVLKKFNLEQLIQIPFDVAVRLTVPDDEGTFQFRPLNNPKQIMEYVQAIDAMRELRQEENK